MPALGKRRKCPAKELLSGVRRDTLLNCYDLGSNSVG